MNVAYNCDCMEYMRTLPDNAFDLAVVDPPYGNGLHAEDGGCKGWFTKYNMTANAEAFEQATAERERERETVTRTGGTWAEKYGKKSSRGT